MQFLTPTDYILGPVVAFMILLVSYYLSRRYYKGHPLRSFLVPGIAVKLFGAFALGMIYQYYYGGQGDTTVYFQGIKEYYAAFVSDPGLFFKLFGYDFTGLNPETAFHFNHVIFDSAHDEEVTVVYLGFLVSLFTGPYYFPISFFFALFSFWGSWKLLNVFAEIYPRARKHLAYSILFIPSIIFWGSGLLKDSVTLGALFLLTAYVFQVFFKRKKLVISLLIILISGYLLFKIKIYIILAFLPALIIWLIFSFWKSFDKLALRIILLPLIIAFGAFSSFYAVTQLGASSRKYSLDKVLTYSEKAARYHYRITKEEGSGYTLGDIEYSPLGIIKAFPKGVVVTLFRPYIWEVRKPIELPASLEGILFLLLTIWVIYKVGIIKMAKTVITAPDVTFCLVFSLVFAFALGISTYNFGALVRYKIPCQPFYLIGLVIIYFEGKGWAQSRKIN